MNNKTSTKTKVPGAGSQEMQLIQQAMEMATQQLDAIKQAGGFINSQYAIGNQANAGLIGGLNDISSAGQANNAQIDQLIQRELARFQSGQMATPEELAEIDAAISGAQRVGEIDIERATTEELDRINQEIAPSLGLRPTDTPIMDRSGKVAAEALRQRGQLSSSLASQRASSILNLPVNRSAILGQSVGLADAVNQNRAALAESAFINRLRLSGQIGSQGLGLATGIPNNLPGLASTFAGTRVAGAGSSTTSPLLTPGLITGGIGGIGGLLSGLGSIGDAGGWGSIFG